MPDSEILWLPHSGEFRRPGQEIEEDYAYPDSSEPQKIQAGENYRYQLTRVLSEAEQESHFDPGAVPVGQALRELAATLNHTTENMTKLNQTFDHFADKNVQQERINKLHTRILKLRMRIANALKLYENYVATMALDELDRRQHLLEDLLEQASLELAKTYDQRSGQ
jgi:hypothetical protein